MKFFKFLFSKAFLTAVLLIAQLALIAVTIIYLEIMPLFRLLSVIVAVAIFLGIINRKENPELKIPWLALLFVLPFFTLMTYILFAHPRIPRKYYDRAADIYARANACMAKNGSDKPSAPLPDEVIGIESYLASTAHLCGHTGNRITYYGSGEQFLDALLHELENAQNYIFMEYFIISPGKMWDSIRETLIRKAAQGVEVRIIYDDIGCVGKLKSNYYKTLRGHGIDCRKFNAFRPIISGIHNNRDHRKITVIDGKTGFTGGINIGDEYINEDRRLGHWKDTAIKIEGSAVDNLLALFLQIFDITDKTKTDYSKYFVPHEKYEDAGYVHPFGDGPNPLYPEQIGENNFINLITSAKNYCYITTPYLIPDYTLINALRSAAFRGVDVRIVTPHIPDKKIVFNMTRSNYACLMEAGVKIYEYTPGFVHAKMLVADDKLAFVGTINLDYRSLIHHFECGAVIYGAPCVADIKKDFDETMAVSQLATPRNPKTGKAASVLNALLKVFSPML